MRPLLVLLVAWWLLPACGARCVKWEQASTRIDEARTRSSARRSSCAGAILAAGSRCVRCRCGRATTIVATSRSR